MYVCVHNQCMFWIHIVSGAAVLVGPVSRLILMSHLGAHLLYHQYKLLQCVYFVMETEFFVSTSTCRLHKTVCELFE
jgi:hypothetical protein